MIESSSKNDCEQESRNLDPFQDQDGSTTLTMSPSVRSMILCQGRGTSWSVDDARLYSCPCLHSFPQTGASTIVHNARRFLWRFNDKKRHVGWL